MIRINLSYISFVSEMNLDLILIDFFSYLFISLKQIQMIRINSSFMSFISEIKLLLIYL